MIERQPRHADVDAVPRRSRPVVHEALHVGGDVARGVTMTPLGAEVEPLVNCRKAGVVERELHGLERLARLAHRLDRDDLARDSGAPPCTVPSRRRMSSRR